MAQRLTKDTIQKIESLRARGFSINEIKGIVPVGQSTITRYAKNVFVPEGYAGLLFGKRGHSIRRMIASQAQAKEKARQWVGNISDRDKLLFVAALYWAEGNKKDLTITNTDPSLIKMFVTCMRETLGVTSDRIQVSIRTYEDLDYELCKKFWESVTGVPSEQFLKNQVLVGKKVGKLKYGMCRVRIKKGAHLHKLMVALKDEMIQYSAPVAQRIE